VRENANGKDGLKIASDQEANKKQPRSRKLLTPAGRYASSYGRQNPERRDKGASAPPFTGGKQCEHPWGTTNCGE